MVIVKGNPTVTAHFAVQVRSKAVLAVGINENECRRTAGWAGARDVSHSLWL